MQHVCEELLQSILKTGIIKFYLSILDGDYHRGNFHSRK